MTCFTARNPLQGLQSVAYSPPWNRFLHNPCIGNAIVPDCDEEKVKAFTRKVLEPAPSDLRAGRGARDRRDRLAPASAAGDL